MNLEHSGHMSAVLFSGNTLSNKSRSLRVCVLHRPYDVTPPPDREPDRFGAHHSYKTRELRLSPL